MKALFRACKTVSHYHLYLSEAQKAVWRSEKILQWEEILKFALIEFVGTQGAGGWAKLEGHSFLFFVSGCLLQIVHMTKNN